MLDSPGAAPPPIAVVEARPRSASFIDLDGTLIRGHTQLGMLLTATRAGHANPWRAAWVFLRYLLYTLGFRIDPAAVQAAGFSLFAGARVDAMERFAEDYARRKVLPHLRPGAARFVADEAALGHVCVLVTTTTEFLARPLAKALGIPSVIATRLEVVDGAFTGRVLHPSPYGAGKRELVERFCRDHSIDPALSRAFGDHESDVALLELVGYRRVVSPTRKLAAIAKARGWEHEDLDTLPTTSPA